MRRSIAPGATAPSTRPTPPGAKAGWAGVTETGSRGCSIWPPRGRSSGATGSGCRYATHSEGRPGFPAKQTKGNASHQFESRQYSTKWLNIGSDVDTFSHMVEHDLNRVFHALADPTRRAILHRLAAGEATVSHLSRPFPVSFAAVSKHLGVLERAGLVTREARGRERVCRINPAALEDARAWLEFHERFWTDRLDALDALVGTGTGKSGESP